jgi:hypothetical protein
MSRLPLIFTLMAVAVAALAGGILSSGAAAKVASRPKLRWLACRNVPNAQCVGLAVPIDPARPSGPHFTLRLGRKPASDPAQKKGVLLLIPGGPGVGIAQIFGQFGTQLHIDDFRRWFDVVTFDPRGVGQSNPVRCDPATVLKPTPPADRAPSPTEFRALAAANARFFKSCFALTGGLMATSPRWTTPPTSNASARR